MPWGCGFIPFKDNTITVSQCCQNGFMPKWPSTFSCYTIPIGCESMYEWVDFPSKARIILCIKWVTISSTIFTFTEVGLEHLWEIASYSISMYWKIECGKNDIKKIRKITSENKQALPSRRNNNWQREKTENWESK